MIVKSLAFQQEEEYALPSTVTVTMSITEAAQIAKIFGEMADRDFERRCWPITHIYRDLTVNVFNRYWEDGLEDALRAQPKE